MKEQTKEQTIRERMEWDADHERLLGRDHIDRHIGAATAPVVPDADIPHEHRAALASAQQARDAAAAACLDLPPEAGQACLKKVNEDYVAATKAAEAKFAEASR